MVQDVLCFAGSQALVAYSLQQSLPDMQFSMVAEEDSADLRYASCWLSQHTAAPACSGLASGIVQQADCAVQHCESYQHLQRIKSVISCDQMHASHTGCQVQRKAQRTNKQQV